MHNIMSQYYSLFECFWNDQNDLQPSHFSTISFIKAHSWFWQVMCSNNCFSMHHINYITFDSQPMCVETLPPIRFTFIKAVDARVSSSWYSPYQILYLSASKFSQNHGIATYNTVLLMVSIALIFHAKLLFNWIDIHWLLERTAEKARVMLSKV